MIIDLHTALEAVESYFMDDTKANVTLGYMAGTQLFKHIFDISLGYFNFNDILLIEGSQDYIGMSSPSPVNNHFFYASLINKIPASSLFNNWNDPFAFNILNNGNPVSEYNCKMDIHKINSFKLVIVCDAHLIPPQLLNELKRKTMGKLIILVDPFTIYGLAYTQVPTVTFSCFECDSLIAMARKIYGVDTDRVKLGPSMFEVVRGHGPRTMTKMTDIQFCSNDIPYLEAMHEKQVNMGIKKTHRVIVEGNQVMNYKMEDVVDNVNDTVTVCDKSLLTIENLTSYVNSHYGARLNNFNNKFYAHLEFVDKTNPYVIDNTILKVKPANILDIKSIGHHKFKKLVYIQCYGAPRLTNPEMYTLATSTEHLTIVEE